MKVLAAILGFFLAALPLGALACDPNEECSRCLVSAFGRCIQRGNDPICEMRKKACQVAPPIVNTPGSPFGPGGPLARGGPIPRETFERCIREPGHCPDEILGRMGYAAVAPIVDQYLGHLRNQAARRWRRLSDEFIADVQPFYSIDLRQVRFAENIDTVHGQAITVGYEIFFPSDIDLDDDDDFKLMLHELEHVVQYRGRGGVEPFLAEYLLKSTGQVISRRSFNVHDYIDIENAAINKANIVFRRIIGWDVRVRNECRFPIRVAIGYRDRDGDWNYEGFWEVNPNDDISLMSRAPVRSPNRLIYAYAETIDGRLRWAGNHQRDVNGRTLPFLVVDRSPGEIDALRFIPTCN
jgi:hypothetical protein